MKINQIPTLVNDAVKEALGAGTGANLETTDIVSVGQALSLANAYDKFYGALLDRMIKTEYMIKVYKRKNRKVIRDEHDFGGFIRRVYYGTIDAVNDPTFEITSDQENYAQASPYDVENTIPVSTLVFGVKGVWSYEFIRPLEVIKTAFLGQSEMDAFLSGLQIEVENEMESAMEALEALAINTAIAQTLVSTKATQKRNLLAEYNTAHATAAFTTVAAALESPEFHRFCVKEINKVINGMKHRSTLYNNAGYRTFTETPVIEMLQEFVSNNEIYLQSDSFNANLVSYGDNYIPVDYWQEQSTDFAKASKINISHDDISNSAVAQSGIICVIRDEDKVAAEFGNRRSYQKFNERSEVMIQMEKASKGYAVDDHMNCVVFYLEVPVVGA